MNTYSKPIQSMTRRDRRHFLKRVDGYITKFEEEVIAFDLDPEDRVKLSGQLADLRLTRVWFLRDCRTIDRMAAMVRAKDGDGQEVREDYGIGE